MDKTVLSAVSLLVCFCLTFKIARACSCHRYPQAQFCDSDFVFVGRVLTELLIPGQQPDPNNNKATWRYTLKLINKLKEDKSSPIGQTVTVYTAGNSGLCGIRLKIESYYLLSGKIENNQKRVSSCMFNMATSDLTFQQMSYIFGQNRNTYQRNCKCKDIKTHDADDFSSSTGCRLPQNFAEKECYLKTALCFKTLFNGCKWRHIDCN